ncbi:MAG: isochorismatase family cysteine hydrolase, partial [Sphingomonas bacterium]
GPVAATIARLRAEADARDVPTIYVNDNFGEWHSDRDRLVAAARPTLADGAIEPRAHDFFVIKPQFSGFYSTNLAVLLPKLGVRRLILTGIATEICILVTASDAHMRDYALWVPENGVVPLDRAHGAAALAIMGMRMDARTDRFEDGALAGWLAGAADKNARR